jgi:hypothetical protein
MRLLDIVIPIKICLSTVATNYSNTAHLLVLPSYPIYFITCRYFELRTLPLLRSCHTDKSTKCSVAKEVAYAGRLALQVALRAAAQPLLFVLPALTHKG